LPFNGKENERTTHDKPGCAQSLSTVSQRSPKDQYQIFAIVLAW